MVIDTYVFMIHLKLKHVTFVTFSITKILLSSKQFQAVDFANVEVYFFDVTCFSFFHVDAIL